MSKDKKGRATSNYRLTMVDDDTHDQLWSRKFTRLNMIITIVTAVLIVLVLIYISKFFELL